jgi:acyl dehydratase
MRRDHARDAGLELVTEQPMMLYCEGIGDDNPLFYDADYAAATR